MKVLEKIFNMPLWKILDVITSKENKLFWKILALI